MVPERSLQAGMEQLEENKLKLLETIAEKEAEINDMCTRFVPSHCFCLSCVAPPPPPHLIPLTPICCWG